jgi:hypothetical protein
MPQVQSPGRLNATGLQRRCNSGHNSILWLRREELARISARRRRCGRPIASSISWKGCVEGFHEGRLCLLPHTGNAVLACNIS